jgi:hypothetical protein
VIIECIMSAELMDAIAWRSSFARRRLVVLPERLTVNTDILLSLEYLVCWNKLPCDAFTTRHSYRHMDPELHTPSDRMPEERRMAKGEANSALERTT